MNHPLTDAYFSGPCHNGLTQHYRDFCRELESGLRGELADLRRMNGLLKDQLTKALQAVADQHADNSNFPVDDQAGNRKFMP